MLMLVRSCLCVHVCEHTPHQHTRAGDGCVGEAVAPPATACPRAHDNADALPHTVAPAAPLAPDGVRYCSRRSRCFKAEDDMNGRERGYEGGGAYHEPLCRIRMRGAVALVHAQPQRNAHLAGSQRVAHSAQTRRLLLVVNNAQQRIGYAGKRRLPLQASPATRVKRRALHASSGRGHVTCTCPGWPAGQLGERICLRTRR